MRTSELESQLAFQLRAEGITGFEQEFRFCPGRRYRADFHVPPDLLVEIEGGHFQYGRHQRPKGFEEDCRKYAIATIGGYRVIRVTGSMVRSGEALDTIKRALERT